MINFFHPDEEARIIEAIRLAELGTTGEIRVHLETDAKVDAITESRQVFRQLGMHETRLRNGVLILLELNRQEFAIIGDEGIDKVVDDNFWDAERDLMQKHFRNRDFTLGLVLVIGRIGEKLKKHFPYTAGGDDQNPNELPNTISYN